MSYGAQGQIGIRQEQSWGVANTTSMYYAYGMEESITTDINRAEYKHIVAKQSEPDDLAGMRTVQGTLVLPAFPQTVWHVMKGIMMTQSNYTVTASDTLWTATYTSPEGEYKTNYPRISHTLEIYRDVTSSHQYTGCMLSRADIKIEINQPTLIGVNIIGRQTSIVSKSIPYYSNDLQPMAFDTCSISIAGVGVNLLESFTLSIDNQLKPTAVLNTSTIIAGIKRSAGQVIRFSGVIDFDNLTEYNKFVNQTEQSLSLSLSRNTPNISRLIVELPRIQYSKFEPEITGRGRIVANIEGKAKYHVGSLTAIKVTVYSQNDYGFFIIGHPVYGVIGTRILW